MPTRDVGRCSIDLVDKTAALSAECVEKTRASWKIRASWQWRHYTTHLCLLFCAWGILELPMANFFEVLRFNSETGKLIMGL